MDLPLVALVPNVHLAMPLQVTLPMERSFDATPGFNASESLYKPVLDDGQEDGNNAMDRCITLSPYTKALCIIAALISLCLHLALRAIASRQ
ncbi:hypothetical protein BC939DRAFT_497453 [Gamsiella multidivaricata]|uniref:uncharacterized protein n=1 Tax=Gamsiella multidivaricata TaxID=101098 RepID=UPI00222089FE|nr:uncharacterized protein BC939DRAFT_497453 [Gamsiella multidivaricata]KAI7816377.1 hypothetical protein BC939DRAFT_497453 [Gamsiella multidivaricata]